MVVRMIKKFMNASRLEHSSALRVVKAVRKALGAVAVEEEEAVLSSITWANVKQILQCAEVGDRALTRLCVTT